MQIKWSTHFNTKLESIIDFRTSKMYHKGIKRELGESFARGRFDTSTRVYNNNYVEACRYSFTYPTNSIDNVINKVYNMFRIT